MDVAAHLVVSGVVQGVGFRYFVYRKVIPLGLKGFVRNLYNGDVEIEVEGDRSLIETLISDMKIGPRSSHVSNVRVTWTEAQQKYRGFEIR